MVGLCNFDSGLRRKYQMTLLPLAEDICVCLYLSLNTTAAELANAFEVLVHSDEVVIVLAMIIHGDGVSH